MRARTVTIGGLAVLAAAWAVYEATDDDTEYVDAQPVCAIDEGAQIRVVDAAECTRDDDGKQTVGGSVYWFHMPYGGTYVPGSYHPTGMSHSRSVPGTKGTARYGQPGTAVKVPARAGFGGTAKGGGAGG